MWWSFGQIVSKVTYLAETRPRVNVYMIVSRSRLHINNNILIDEVPIHVLLAWEYLVFYSCLSTVGLGAGGSH
jgi:hypothetical protein